MKLRFKERDGVKMARNNCRKGRVETTYLEGNEYPWRVRVTFHTGMVRTQQFKNEQDARNYVDDVGAL